MKSPEKKRVKKSGSQNKTRGTKPAKKVQDEVQITFNTAQMIYGNTPNDADSVGFAVTEPVSKQNSCLSKREVFVQGTVESGQTGPPVITPERVSRAERNRSRSERISSIKKQKSSPKSTC